MARVRAGDIRQVILGGREFDPAPESSWNMRLTRRNNEVAITGNNQAHVTQTTVSAGIGDCALSIDNERGDHEYIQEWAESGEFRPCTVTEVDGTVYSGDLLPVGEIEKATGEGQLTLELRGVRLERL